ncbi:MAG: 30S ribosomal protein S3 [Planctomycetota bacterium]|nr:MAG: 30S ribosomal protein S3 [Planctomycetota bacterium]
MGQKTSPIGFRTGITLDWQSTWFAPKANYGEFLVEDWKIRKYIDKKFNRQPPYSAVSKVKIERTRNEVKVTLHTARPGMVIGPRGAEVETLREELEELIDRKININVIEIKEPALDATLVAEAIALQLKKRASYRRAMKAQCENAMNAGAKGVKIICGGRLAGAEIARSETQKLGSIPLQTLDANVDYGVATSHTTYGTIGIKVWIYKGKFGQEIVPVSRPRRQSKPRHGGGRGGGRSAGSSKSSTGSTAKGSRAQTAKTRKGPAEAKPTEPEIEDNKAEAPTETDGAQQKSE